MKIQSGIVSFFALAIISMVSFTNGTGTNRSDMLIWDPVKPDTTINNLPFNVEAFNLEIHPPSSGIQFFKDGIVYLGSSKSEKEMISDHLSFGKIDARYAVLKDSALENPSAFSPSLSFTYPCEAITFSSDYNTMYFTKFSPKDGSEKIYQAKFSQGSGNQGNWTVDENPLSFCSGQSTYTHPALSADGKVMIFASNRPGSVGGLDLFVTQNKGGTWSDPVNLGSAVNSKSNELYPFLDSENNLYFSSDGIMGYGGYDIFVCKFKGNTWEKPINLAFPINTRFDDVAFTVNRKDGKSAFYTVKQKSGKESLQLYRVEMNSNSGQDNFVTLSQFFTNPAVSHIVTIVTEPAVQATDKKPETAPKISESRGGKANVVYRVQFMASFNPRTRSQITLNGKEYNIYEYLYSGAYRLCIGEFSALSPAKELQNILIQNDYPQAIVVVFVNNVRSMDPELLKDAIVSTPVAAAKKPIISESAAQVKPAETKVETVKKDILVPEAKKPETLKTESAKTTPVKTEPAKPTITEPIAQKEMIAYRVQIGSNNTKKGSYKITINNKVYNTFEYFYSGVYRTCVGNYSTLTPAKELQNICRKSGYPQAFVVAFKNGIRTTDPALFK
jgi:hypothetical protein